jgi:serine/threonine protein kinase
VHDVGEIGGIHYISMGYLEGKPLSAFVRPDKPLTEKQAVMIIRKLAVALNKAHGKGIIHRDLKPDNVIIDLKSNPVIMDFGLARRSAGADDIRVTQGGQMLGTPA